MINIHLILLCNKAKCDKFDKVSQSCIYISRFKNSLVSLLKAKKGNKGNKDVAYAHIPLTFLISTPCPCKRTLSSGLVTLKIVFSNL